MKFPLVGRRLVAALLSTSCGFLSCGPPPPAKVAIKPEPLSASDLLPSDLDFVFRIDSGRVRANPMFTGAFREVASGEGSAGSRRLASLPPRTIEACRWRVPSAIGFGDGVVAHGGWRRGSRCGCRVRREPLESRARRLASRFWNGQWGAARTLPSKSSSSTGIVLATLGEADAVLRLVRLGPDGIDSTHPHEGSSRSLGGFVVPGCRGSLAVMGCCDASRKGSRAFPGA